MALVGPIGCGKTTVFNLLLRFLDPQQGRIMLDGHDIGRVTISTLREQVSKLAQFPFFAKDTVRENVRMSRPDASDAEVEEACRLAQVHTVHHRPGQDPPRLRHRDGCAGALRRAEALDRTRALLVAQAGSPAARRADGEPGCRSAGAADAGHPRVRRIPHLHRDQPRHGLHRRRLRPDHRPRRRTRRRTGHPRDVAGPRRRVPQALRRPERRPGVRPPARPTPIQRSRITPAATSTPSVRTVPAMASARDFTCGTRTLARASEIEAG